MKVHPTDKILIEKSHFFKNHPFANIWRCRNKDYYPEYVYVLVQIYQQVFTKEQMKKPLVMKDIQFQQKGV